MLTHWIEGLETEFANVCDLAESSSLQVHMQYDNHYGEYKENTFLNPYFSANSHFELYILCKGYRYTVVLMRI